MGHAKYVGRVGGLAVALGVGVAVATTPGVAWAGPTDSGATSSSTDSSSDSSTGSASGADTQSPSSTESSQSAPAGEGAGASSSGSGSSAGSDTSKDTGNPAGKKSTTKSAVKDKKSGSERSAAAAAPKKPKRPVVSTRSDADSSGGQSATATTSQPKAAPTTDNASTSASVDVAPAPINTATVADPEVTSAPAAATTPLSAATLTAVGLAPSADGDAPDAPGDSPLMLAGLAAFRRQTQQGLVEDEAITNTAPDPSQTSLMMTTAAAVNSAPTAAPVVGLPDPTTAAVQVSLNASDADGNQLSYSVTGQPTAGTLVASGAGNYTYTPTQAARLQAATTTGLDTDTFTVRVSDGQAYTDVPITVVVRPAQLAAGAPVDVDRDPSGVAFSADGSRAYVTNKYDKTVSVVNTSSGAVVATIKVPYAPTAVVVSPVATQNRAYVAMTTGVAVIDTSTNKLVDVKPSTTAVDSIAVGASPSALAINSTGARLYVSNGGSSTVSVINTATNTEITRVTVGSQPSGLAVSPDDSRVYALSRYTDKVTVIRTSDNVVIGSATVGDSPRGVVVSPDGKRIYVSNYNSGTVTVLDTSGNTPVFVKTLTVGTQPEGIAMTKDGSLVYVANGKDTVSVIDTRTNTILGPAVSIDSPAESGAHAIAVSGDKLYVTDYVDDWVRTINVARVETAPQSSQMPTQGTPDSATGTVVGDLQVVDTDGDALGYNVITQPTKGTVTISPNGSYSYTPMDAARLQAGPNTTDTFTVRVSDTLNATKDVTVTVPVSPKAATPPPPDPTNHPPVASPSIFAQDQVVGAVTGSVHATDADGNALTYTVIGAPSHGTVVLNPYTGSYAYTSSAAARLAANQTSGPDTDTFTVAVSDGKATVTTPVTVPISPANVTVSPTTTTVGSGALGIAFRGNYAFVANQGAGTVSVIDMTTNSIVATLPVGAAPTSVATINASPSYQGTYAYVTNRDSNSVSVINTYTNTVDNWIPVGSQPWGVVETPNLAQVYVTNSGSNTVSVIDTSSRSVVATIPVGGAPTGVAVSGDGTRVYVANKTSNTVSVIDTATKAVVATVPVGINPMVLAVSGDGSHVYVANKASNTVSVIDTASKTVVATVGVGSNPMGVAVSPDGTLYVANGNDTISVIDTGTNAVVRTVTMDAAPETGMHLLAVDPYGRVYTTDAADGVVRSFSIAAPASSALPVTSTAVSVGSNPSGVAVAGNRAYVLNTGSDTISVIDTTTKQVIKTIPVGAGATTVVVTPNGQRLYVANYDTVSVIDTASGNEVVAPITIPDLCENGSCYGSSGGITDLAISPDGSRAYAVREYYTDTGQFSGVSIIGTNTNTVTTTTWTYPLNDIDVSGDGTRLYGAEGDYRFVNVFDATTLSGPGYIDVSTPEPGWAYTTAVATSPDGRRTYAIVNTDEFSYRSNSKYVSVIDTDPASPTYNTQIGQIAVAYGAKDIAVSPDNSRLYVTLADGATVEVFDTASNTALGYFVKPSSGSLTVGPDGTVYLTDYANGTVYSVTVGTAPSSL
uniref:beta-propeller fold lactonase family protein n=1 Tax=Mycobacterium sp. OAE908 TaxID=2817899 RepID=UPI0034E1DD11